MIKSRKRWMTLALILSSCFTTALFANKTFAAGAGSAAYAGDIKSGEEESVTCAACHGADGNSPAPSFPKIAGLGKRYIFKQLKDIQSGARPIVEMTGLLDEYVDEDLMDIAAYFDSKTMQLSGAKELTVKVNSGIEVDGLVLGERVFRAGNLETKVPSCTGCHSPLGLGNEPAAYPRLSGQYSEYIAKQLRAFRAGERTNDGDSQIMRQVAAQMSDAEIDAVANYISGLN